MRFSCRVGKAALLHHSASKTRVNALTVPTTALSPRSVLRYFILAMRPLCRNVLAIWTEVLGDRMWIRSREEAIAAGWFGPRVSDEARTRIGDVVAAAHGPVGVVQRDVDPLQAMLTGHHGSLTAAERSVPFLAWRRDG